MYIYILVGIILALLLFTLYIQNKLTKLSALVDEAWSGVDVQLQRRYSLIPNLVSTVKEYAKREQTILENVASLRSEALKAESRKDVINKNIDLERNLQNIFVTVENYPEVKSNNNFLEIQKQFYEIEDNIQLSRRYYNGTVRNYNIGISLFPNNLFAKVFNYQKRPFFEAEEIAKRDMKVEL